MTLSTSLKKIRLNLTLKGVRTSLALEDGTWKTLTEICRREEMSLDELCEYIVERRSPPNASMSSAIRMYALSYFRDLVMTGTKSGLINQSSGPTPTP